MGTLGGTGSTIQALSYETPTWSQETDDREGEEPITVFPITYLRVVCVENKVELNIMKDLF